MASAENSKNNAVEVGGEGAELGREAAGEAALREVQ